MRFAAETQGKRLNVKSPPADFGTAMHAALDKYIERMYDADGLSLTGCEHNPEMLFDIWEAAANTMLPFGTDYNDEGYALLTDWVRTRELPKKVLSREVKERFEIEVPGFEGATQTITYICDRVDETADGIEIVDYKGLALDTRLPTPTGWTTMGSVLVGDRVIGGDGQPCSVIGKSTVHHRPCYQITFDDSTTVVADNEHLWAVTTDAGDKILATEELAENVTNAATGQRHLRIDNVTVSLPAAELPLDPYVLGAWLGDGDRAGGQITKPCDALFAEIERRGFTVGPVIGKANKRTVYGIVGLLRSLGVLHDKHIPQSYLRGSRLQRLDLLRGLMDTDGHWNVKRQRAVINLADEQLAAQIAELVNSLGWKATTFKTIATGFGKVIDAWQVWFTPFGDEIFVARRPASYRQAGTTVARRRLIRSVEPISSVPTQCIMVDSPDNTYLCGEQMVRTHNTQYERVNAAHMRRLIQPNLYALAMRKKYETDLVAVTYDLIRYDAVTVYFTGKQMDAFERYLKAAARKVWLDDDPRESVNKGCKWCMRKSICGALGRAVELQYTPAMSPDDLAELRDKAKYAAKAFEVLLNQVDEVLLEHLRREDTDLLDAGEREVRATTRRTEKYDPEVVLRVLGNDALPFMSVGKGALEKEFKRRDGRFDSAQIAAVRDLSAVTHGDPQIEVTRKGQPSE